MSVTQLKTPAEAALVAAARAAAGHLPGDGAVKALRGEAVAALEARGLPHRRIEAWHYTDLRTLWRDVAAPAVPTAVPVALPPKVVASALRVVLVDGAFRADLSELAGLPAGITITALSEVLASGRDGLVDELSGPAIARGDELIGLNAAFMTDGVVIEVAAGAKIATPVELTSVVTAGAAKAVHARSLLVMGAGSELALIEQVETPEGGNQTTDVLNVTIGDGARLAHVRLAARDHAAVSLSAVTALIGRDVLLESLTVGTPAQLTRREIFAHFKGDRSHARFDSAALLKGRSHADGTLVVDHEGLACESRELFRTVVDEEARGVFQGKVVVRPGAQKTDGRMASNGLLLSDTSEMMNKPELEIFADDVQCAHGATCGAIDERSLFYLMSRGIPRHVAEGMLVRAFVAEVIERIGEDDPFTPVADELHAALEAHVDAWLAARKVA